ncbi:glycosyltransferase family 2 protein [Pseudalkalibacillus caeni]|uniref:Glycosyltransferase n=1 Tax=Exobacillus caeni TaxID=2574798 RepID=A0A5R9FCV0_9BACL|nr:glycosyltransferase [Pseudalkalibacillus caeni]TLS37475.1 glycosyltransferase [Pseudalkalibacillus caeni]
MADDKSVSIIFPVKNEGINIKNTLNSLFSVKTTVNLEVIVVNDGSDDGCCKFLQTYTHSQKVRLIETTGIGAAKARNLGAEQASHDYLVFSDAHLTFEDFWIERLLAPILTSEADAVTPAIASSRRSTFVGYGQTLLSNLKTKWNKKKEHVFETAVLPGGCFIISKAVFENIGGFESGFRTWGFEDVELSIKLWLFGYRCCVQPAVTVVHLFRATQPYHVPSADYYYNLLRTAYSHFNEKRIAKCKMLIKNPDTVERLVLSEGVLEQRNVYFLKRKHDDNWYFTKFQIDF